MVGSALAGRRNSAAKAAAPPNKFITEMANAGAPVQANNTDGSIDARALFLHGAS